jgi:hypothetical protein
VETCDFWSLRTPVELTGELNWMNGWSESEIRHEIWESKQSGRMPFVREREKICSDSQNRGFVPQEVIGHMQDVSKRALQL